MQKLWQTLKNASWGQSWDRPDPLSPWYRYFDWNRCVIGGSYALNQLTGDTTWTPDDVDVVCVDTRFDEWKVYVEQFCHSTNGKLLKLNDFRDGHPHDPDKRDEKFHESIRASAKVKVAGLDQVIQFVYIETNPPTVEQLRIVLDEITDVPACVNYQLSPLGQKQFHIPEKGLEALFTRRVAKKDICESRMAKYEARQYTFY